MPRSTARSTSCASSAAPSAAPASEGAAEGDRVTIDFEGKIDGEGVRRRQGRGLPVRDRRRPDARAVRQGSARHAGRRIEDLSAAVPRRLRRQGRGRQGSRLHGHDEEDRGQHLPAVDEAFIKSLGIGDGTIEALRADVRKNLEREVKFRVLRATSGAVMDALVKLAELDVPNSLVDAEVERMTAGAREDLKQRRQGCRQGADPGRDLSSRRPERRVRLGLVVANWCAAEPAGQARSAAGAHRRAVAKLREAGRGDALVPVDRSAWRKSRRWWSRTTSRHVLASAKVVDKQLAFDADA